MATYQISDLPNIEGFSGYRWRYILEFANGAPLNDPQAYNYVSSSLCLRLTVFEQKISYILKSSWWGLEKSKLPWEHIVFIAIDVFPVELLAYQVSMVCVANKIAQFM